MEEQTPTTQEPAEEPTQEEQTPTTQELKQKFKEHAEKTGIKLNPDDNRVNEVIKGLIKKKEKFGDIYCPCRVVSGDKEKDKEIICPCIFHKKEIELQGHCLCNLFVR